MASAKMLNFKNAIEYMDPMEVTDYLQKILDFLQRNNNEIYFPSISSYVEAFLVNLASDNRNLRSKLFKHEDRKLALDIIEVLEMSRDVFRWTHSYENGNLLVYKKIFSNKMKKKPKPSSIAHRLLQAQTQRSTITHADTNQPEIPVTTKLQFLNKTLRFIKDGQESTPFYEEMPYELAEYVYYLFKYRDKEADFGYKTLYAPLWEAVEEYGADYEFEVTIEETSCDSAVATEAGSKSLAPATTRDRSISKDRLIQFQQGGKLHVTGNESTTDNDATCKDSPQDRGRSKDGMSKRAAKLLEDLSTPIESDKAMRMMLLMGWDGGALGARGDGITEPVMPNIELLSRGGLGHVPPTKAAKPPKLPKISKIPKQPKLPKIPKLPKPSKFPKWTSRQPLDFRIMFMHNLYDFLVHEDHHKGIQFNEPLIRKECKFIKSSLTTLNNRRMPSLTEQERELVRSVVGEFAGRPGLVVWPAFSTNLRTVTLQKLTEQPAKAPKKAAPKAKPKPVKNQSDVISITNDDADVVITELDVVSAMPLVEMSETNAATDLKGLKAIRKRAVRLIFLTKFAEALHRFQPRTVFKFHFIIAKNLKMFIRTTVKSLNKGCRPSNLFGWETQTYEGLLHATRGSVLVVEFLPRSKCLLIRTPLISKVSANAGPVRDNNRNQMVNLNEYNFRDANSNLDINYKDDYLTRPSIEKYGLKETSINAESIADGSRNNRTANIRVKHVNVINAEVNSNNLTANKKLEGVEVKTETECDIVEPNVKESNMVIKSEVNNDSMTDTAELFDLDRDIAALQMTLLKADLDRVLKKENDDCDLEMENSETDLKINVKKEQDIDYRNTKRPHSSFSQDPDSKKVKMSTETDEHKVIIIPNNPDEGMREETVIEIQTLMANEIDKTGGYLPLLKCHGVHNGGLIYSCHDEDDVGWLKNVISAANLDVEIVPSNDLYFDKNSRELLFRINSYIPLDAKKIFHKFELYNVGLNTKHWKVSYKHTETTFVMFKVTVDEKSFKYISDEKFSLYCGIDKAEFSVIFLNRHLRVS